MKSNSACTNIRLRVVLIAAFTLLAQFADATERRFTYVYDVSTAAPGEVEIENWITWKTQPSDNSRFNQVKERWKFSRQAARSAKTRYGS